MPKPIAAPKEIIPARSMAPMTAASNARKIVQNDGTGPANPLIQKATIPPR